MTSSHDDDPLLVTTKKTTSRHAFDLVFCSCTGTSSLVDGIRAATTLAHSGTKCTIAYSICMAVSACLRGRRWTRPRILSLSCKSVLQFNFFDFIELSFKLEVTRHITTDGSDVVDAVNQVFRVERAPYQLTSMVWIEEKRNRIVYRRPSAYPKVIRTEDEVTSEMAVVPALSVLTAPHFESASLEFRDALEEYRKGDYGDCLTKCSSALESTLKVLCTKNGWIANERVTINQLLDTVVDQTTLDSFFKQPLVLIATMRNRLSKSHGGGSSVRTVERHIAEYAITSTAAAIVLLVRDLNN